MKLVFAILMMTTSAFASDLKMTELVQARPASSVMVDELDEVIASGTNLDRVTQLLDMYAQGMAPSQEETEGWWSGRCYYKAEPNTPNGALMVVWQITLPPTNGGANEGPLFPEEPPTRVFNLGVIGNQNKIADQYDHITPTVKKDVSKTLNSAEALPLNSFYEQNALTSRYEKGNYKFSIRKYQSYFISIGTLLKDQPPQRARDVDFACYYFKKVN